MIFNLRRHTQKVSSIEEAVRVFCQFRDEHMANGKGNSTIADGQICTGANVFRISWNGSVWAPNGQQIYKTEWASYGEGTF